MSETSNGQARPESMLGVIDTTDRRTIEEARFGLDAPEADRESVERRVRGILVMCDVKIVDDINRLGCTGLAKAFYATSVEDRHAATGNGHSVVAIGAFLRLGLAGCGTGLPCFVPPTRFCLVHNTVGGLMENQRSQHSEFVEQVSRELTAAERVSVGLTEKARHTRGGERGLDAMDMLSGQRLDDVREVVEGLDSGLDVVEAGELKFAQHEAVARAVRGTREEGRAFAPWKCEEHTATVWSCRHCLAQAIVEGSIDPVFYVENDLSPAMGVCKHKSADIEAVIEEASNKLSASLGLYVRVATFTRKLARD